MIERLFRYLSSLRFTLLLIISLGTLFLLGIWIPQKSLLQGKYQLWKAGYPSLVSFLETLHLTEIYTSPLTLALWGFFFVNLALVMWQRVPVVRQKLAFSPAKLGDPLS